MLFVKTAELKAGMRLARPIYSKEGVLLYERNSKLTSQSINSVRNFGLIGIFILEPAEPVPPMTKDDIEFERFQTMNVYAIEDELSKIIQTKRAAKTQVITANVIRSYGHLDKKINFVQNLRSKEDYVCKHALNVAILCAMITHVMNMKLDEQLETIIAAIVHDIGKLMLGKSAPERLADAEAVESFEVQGFDLVDKAFSSNPGVKRICVQAQKMQSNFEKGVYNSDIKLVSGAKVLLVANMYDEMTAMQFEGEPASEVRALRLLLENPDVFDPNVVDAMIRSINILGAGSCVELNTGEKGLVLVQNNENILRPMILTFDTNMIVDLGNEMAYGDMEIKDIMKTMDNRYVIDTEALKRSGFAFEEPEYVEVPEEEGYVPGRDF
ncbi:MAG: phosphohydrolase [Lachnospiraceae bacterium]|nr:phosphohydrolase [Lachnospiraceae bacterium]